MTVNLDNTKQLERIADAMETIAEELEELKKKLEPYQSVRQAGKEVE